MARSRTIARTVGVVAALGLLLTAFLIHRGTAEPLPAPYPSRESIAAEVPAAMAPTKRAPGEQDESPPGIDPKRLLSFLRTTVTDYKRNVSEPQHGVSGRFANETFLKLRELRLLAKAYPELIRAEVLRLAKDDTADLLERFAALYMLGVLAGGGDGEAEATLLGMSRDKDERLAEQALGNLVSADGSGKHRDLYRERALKGSAAAIQALSTWADGSAEPFFLQVIASLPEGKQSPAYETRLRVEEALERTRLLGSATGQAETLRIIEEYARDSMSTPWALRAAEANRLEGALPAMRKRLDADEARVAEHLDEIRGRAVNSLVLPDTNRELATSTTVVHREDEFYDDVLVAYSRMGGRVTTVEQERLRTFGYACDPKERLGELISNK